jgi:catechol 2,3-dioxygenase-like lactoylglutathione lyase family enzyme
MVETKYVDSTEQLVTEIVVRDIRRSTKFYTQLGFKLHRDAGDFVELTWEDHRLFITEISAFPETATTNTNKDNLIGSESDPSIKFPNVNIRVMVPNVDEYWKLSIMIGARIVIPVGDRYYGLRDFTIADPDGFGVRFATMIEEHRHD